MTTNRTITVADDVYARIMALTTPLFDINDVLRRLLDRTDAPAQVAQPAPVEPPAPSRAPAAGPAAAPAPPSAPTRADARDAAAALKPPIPLHTTSNQGDDAMTHRSEYIGFIVNTLTSMGGAASTRDLKARAERDFVPKLKPADLAPIGDAGTELRWWNQMRFARLDLVQNGTLKRGSKHGVWELNGKGR
jgi:hypothetical protein